MIKSFLAYYYSKYLSFIDRKCFFKRILSQKLKNRNVYDKFEAFKSDLTPKRQFLFNHFMNDKKFLLKM